MAHNFKRPLLYLLICSVIIGAALGIGIVLRDKWGWYESRVILTTITIAVASLCGLACELSKTPRGFNLLPYAGLLLTFLAAAMILVFVWLEFDRPWYLKATASVSILAVAMVHVCLLSIARLSRRFSWVFMIASQVIFGLALLLCTIVIAEIDTDKMWRFVAVVSIVDAALTLIIPLLHRISKTDYDHTEILTTPEERNVVAIEQEISQLRNRIAALEELRSEIMNSPDEGG